MPRQSRIDAPGALHHVMIRGIERRKIFRDDKDRESFLDRLGGILLESATPCYAWSLLGNHAHFLFRTGRIPISGVMRKLLTGYAVTFNRRYHRHGHVFQNRYKSILCEEDAYLQELVRYIHLNPLRAGLVKDLRELGSRAMLCYVGVRKLGLTAVYVAKELGVSPSSVSKSIVRGRQALKNEAIEEYLLESQ